MGAMATTAVVAGTASAVAHSREQKYTQQEAAAPPPAEARPDRIQQLKDLAALKEAGVLTDQEFQAEKARILAS